MILTTVLVLTFFTTTDSALPPYHTYWKEQPILPMVLGVLHGFLPPTLLLPTPTIPSFYPPIHLPSSLLSVLFILPTVPTPDSFFLYTPTPQTQFLPCTLVAELPFTAALYLVPCAFIVVDCDTSIHPLYLTTFYCYLCGTFPTLITFGGSSAPPFCLPLVHRGGSLPTHSSTFPLGCEPCLPVAWT